MFWITCIDYMGCSNLYIMTGVRLLRQVVGVMFELLRSNLYKPKSRPSGLIVMRRMYCEQKYLLCTGAKTSRSQTLGSTIMFTPMRMIHRFNKRLSHPRTSVSFVSSPSFSGRGHISSFIANVTGHYGFANVIHILFLMTLPCSGYNTRQCKFGVTTQLVSDPMKYKLVAISSNSLWLTSWWCQAQSFEDE